MAEYIERDAAIAALNKVRDDQRVFKYATASDFLSARDAIERAAKMLESLPAADVEPVQEWISVYDERKPKEGEDVLVAVFDGYDTYTDIDCLMRDGKWCFETENYKVTHWMEKPEPPKGE